MGLSFFGSELKSFYPHPNWNPSLDHDAIHLYLRHAYIPTPYSIYKNIFKLEPGSFVVFDIKNKICSKPKLYWNLIEVISKSTQNRIIMSDSDLVEELDAKLKRSVQMRMISDVPIGAFLSGGIDSSLITSLMQALSKKPINTFTIGFDVPGYNEADHAKNISKHLGTNHNELYLTEKDTLDSVSDLSKIWDEPFADSSQIPTLLLSRLTKGNVSVALSGDGGDEIFCGYNRYSLGFNLYKYINTLPKKIRLTLSSLLRNIPASKVDKYINLFFKENKIPAIGDRLQKLGNVVNFSEDSMFYKSLISCFQNPSEYLKTGNEPLTFLSNDFVWEEKYDFREIMMFLDMKTYLPDDILVKVDRSSMSVGLETRVPFLDHELIEWAWRLPFDKKLSSGKLSGS